MRRSRSASLVIVVLASLHWLIPGVAQAATVVVTGPSPYASCDRPTFRGERTFVNGEVEPWLAIDPSDATHLVGVWQQDRHSFGGANGLASATSFDGGATWTEMMQPFDRCALGGVAFARASDPWVSIGPDGTVYSVSISFAAKGWNNSVVAATSHDGGLTWDAPNFVQVNKGEVAHKWFADKESVTADPTRPGVAYVVWDRVSAQASDETEGEGERRMTTDQTPRASAPIWFSMTTDGGMTWSAAKAILKPGQHNFTIANQVIVDPVTGNLFDFYGYARGRRLFECFISSSDGGLTWSGPHRIARDLGLGVADPRTGRAMRVGALPDAAVDPTTGDLYVTWEDSRFTNGRYDQIVLSRSTDSGETWSDPIRVGPRTGLPAFTPSIEVSSSGVVGVTFYDLRDERTVPEGIPVAYWLDTLSTVDLAPITETRLATFDDRNAPRAFGALFLGDYEGLVVRHDAASDTDLFQAFFVVANTTKANRSDVVTIAA